MQDFQSKSDPECTVGVIHLDGGLLFFKNRDLQREYLINRLTAFQSTPESHSLKGFNLKTKELEGVSIGVNRYKVCVANTHVESSNDLTYDILCELLLSQVKSRSDVPGIVNDFMGNNRVQGGRILVSSLDWNYLIEVFQDDFRIQEIEEQGIVITNNFSLIPHQAERPLIREESSIKRHEVASEMIKELSNIGMLKSMLRSHVPEKGELSICNHQEEGGGTESSHIIQIQGNYIGWSSLIGFPCENDYRATELFQ